MIGLCHLLLTLGLAFALPIKLRLFRDLAPGLPRLLFAAGVVFFALTWVDFGLYVTLGWGRVYDAATWAIRIGAALWCAKGLDYRALTERETIAARLRTVFRPSHWPAGFLFVALLVLSRFWYGIVIDEAGSVWSNFNFVDTAFHLSVAQAFLAAPHFPPMDLNADGFPLKYHFLADFPLAHFARLGMPIVSVTYWLNLFSGAVAVGAVWACFQAWLRLPARWVLSAALVFFFINTSVVNLIHYVLLDPPYFNANSLVGDVMLFPYFNFESHLNNMLEPQRGLLFSLPVALAILHVCFGPRASRAMGADDSSSATVNHEVRRTLAAFAGVCLLPFAHVVSFAMLVPCLLLRLWKGRTTLTRRAHWLAIFFAIGLAQLYYLRFYGPPLDHGYAAWDALRHMAIQDFRILPPPLHWAAFWLAVNGDYLFWSGLFIVLALFAGRLPPAIRPRLRPLLAFLRRWRIYFLVCGGAFVAINFYRYAANWGDSNKFVFFLNLGLCLVIAQGAARMGPAARPLWGFFLVLTLFPYTWDFQTKVIRDKARTHLLFHHHTHFAALWLDRHLPIGSRLVTAESMDTHFVSALTGRPVIAGIYSNTNPYVSEALRLSIIDVYEKADMNALRSLDADFLFISAYERDRYRLHPFWTEQMKNPSVQAFAIGRPDDHRSVFIFRVKLLAPPTP